MTSKEAASKRIRELEEELEGHRKKARSTSDSVAAEYTCPLSLEVFVDPVRAEDGFDYERADIERAIKHQGEDLTSPQTGETMGPTLTPSYNVKNAVEALVATGTISGEHAETYKNSKLVMETKQKAEDGDAKSMELLADWYKVGRNGLSKSQALSDEWRERAEKADDDEYITELKASASAGDTAAMYNLGNAYENGLRGLAEGEEKAFEWYSKAADGMDTAGIAMKAYFLVNGHGGAEVNVSYGTSQMFYAAGAGSDLASREVGIWYLHGLHGIPANMVKARYFLDRATNGLCAELHMKPVDLEEAKQLLNQLDLQREEEDTDPLPPTSQGIGGKPTKKKSSRSAQGAAQKHWADGGWGRSSSISAGRTGGRSFLDGGGDHKNEPRRCPSISDMRTLMSDLGPTSKTACVISGGAKVNAIREAFSEWFPDFYAQFRYDEKRGCYLPRHRSLREERRRRMRLRFQ